MVPVVSKSQASQLWPFPRQWLVEAWAEGQGAKLRGTETFRWNRIPRRFRSCIHVLFQISIGISFKSQSFSCDNPERYSGTSPPEIGSFVPHLAPVTPRGASNVVWGAESGGFGSRQWRQHPYIHAGWDTGLGLVWGKNSIFSTPIGT